MSDYDNALRAAAHLNVGTTPQLDKFPILYSGPSLDIKYTVCPESDVASRCRAIYTIDVQRLRRLHKDKWFEIFLSQLGWKFGSRNTQDMSIHVAGECGDGALTAKYFETTSADTLEGHVFHVHFAKRGVPPPQPARPYEFDVEEDELLPLAAPVHRIVVSRVDPELGQRMDELAKGVDGEPRWAPSPGKPYPYPAELEK